MSVNADILIGRIKKRRLVIHEITYAPNDIQIIHVTVHHAVHIA